MENIKTYNLKEAESILHVKSAAIRNYIKSGKLKASKIGRGWIINEADLKAFIKSNS